MSSLLVSAVLSTNGDRQIDAIRQKKFSADDRAGQAGRHAAIEEGRPLGSQS
jgi:hypothetical protein